MSRESVGLWNQDTAYTEIQLHKGGADSLYL